MTPAARVAAASEILDRILAGDPAEPALIRWARASRYAGSGDRAAVRDLVYDSLRKLRSRAALGGGLDGRALMLGMCRETGQDPAQVFTGQGHAPAVLTDAEKQSGNAPSPSDAMDLPDWLIPLWRDSLGERADPMARQMRERAPVWLRVNTARTTPDKALRLLAQDGIVALPAPQLPSALRVVEGARRVAASASYCAGDVELQDLSAQLACAALPIQGSVLDFCAGGGGKALALAARGAGPIVAHDSDMSRMADLPARAARAGARVDIARPGKVSGTFGLVVADVPCSGSGTWRRTPDAKWRLTADGLQEFLKIQAQIIDKACKFTCDGGYLVYMTCSVLQSENADQIAAFLHRNPAFELVEEQIFGPWNASDGFYLSLLRRN